MKKILFALIFLPTICFSSVQKYWCGMPVEGLTSADSYLAMIDDENMDLKIYSIYLGRVEVELNEDEYQMTVSEGRRHIKHSSEEDSFYLNCEVSSIN